MMMATPCGRRLSHVPTPSPRTVLSDSSVSKRDKLFTLPGQGMSILHDDDTCLVFLGHGTILGGCRLRQRETSCPSPARNSVFFFFGMNSCERFWGLVVWMLCIGRARHPGPIKKPCGEGDSARHSGVEVLNVAGWFHSWRFYGGNGL